MSIDDLIASRLQERRKANNLTIEALASRCEVSKAMISKIERRQSSPSAAILGRLAAGLGVTLAELLAERDQPPQALRPLAQQETWHDPDIGYQRRQVSEREDKTGLEMVEIVLPGGARASYPRWSTRPYRQRLWLIEGELTIDYGEQRFNLKVGDCLNFGVDRPLVFHNPGAGGCRYLLVITDE